MKTSQAKRLKELEKENQRLKRAVADLTVDTDFLGNELIGVPEVDLLGG